MSNFQDEALLKKQVHDYWNAQPCGTQFTDLTPGTKEFYREIERYRYAKQPFMERLCGFKKYSGKKLLEIGCGLGTDSLQFARNGAFVTGIDITEEGPHHAQERFHLEGLAGTFIQADAEHLHSIMRHSMWCIHSAYCIILLIHNRQSMKYIVS